MASTEVMMDEPLKLLFDYTKFHIGLYATLITGIIAVFANDGLKKSYTKYLPFMWIVIVSFFVAGVAGGIVASSIPFYNEFAIFKDAPLGPAWLPQIFNSYRPKATTWTNIEHGAFWLGIFFAVVGVVFVTRRDLRLQPKEDAGHQLADRVHVNLSSFEIDGEIVMKRRPPTAGGS